MVGNGSVSAMADTGAPSRQERPTAARRTWGVARKLSAAWPPTLGLIFGLCAWQAAVEFFRIPAFIIPSPLMIGATLSHNWESLRADALMTTYEAVTGYLVGSAIGVALGIVMIVVPPVERALLKVYIAVNSVPMVAFGPLVVIWFGIEPAAKIILIAVAVSYKVLLHTLAGLKLADPAMIALLRTFGASRGKIMMVLQFPGALQSIFAGLKVSVVSSVILAVVVEMLGSRVGLGWSVYQSTQMFNFVDAWAAVLVAMAISLMMFGFISWIGKVAIWWPR